MAFLLYRIGFMLRETGQALDRVGCRLQLNYPFREESASDNDVLELLPRLLSISPSDTLVPKRAYPCSLTALSVQYGGTAVL